MITSKYYPALQVLSCLLLLSVGFPQASAEESSGVTAGTVLELMFSPGIRTRGFYQQRSLDTMLADSKSDLQVAFVIDGTNSMQQDISGVLDSLKFFVGQLREAKGEDKVAFSLVIYRDEDAASGPTSMPLMNDFTKSYSDLEAAISAIQVETGEPWFPEAIDAGIYEALADLDWKDPQLSTRWVIVFGDAPPYAEGYKDERGARRRFTNDQLITVAKEQQATISAILCASGFADTESEANERLKNAYNKSKPQLREFFDALATATGGAVWDLSDELIRDKLAEAAKAKHDGEQGIQPITPEDIAAAMETKEGTLRLAVLPHLPLAKMTFEPDNEAVLASTEIRMRLGSVPGIDIANPTEVANAFEDSSPSPSDDPGTSLSDEDRLSDLAMALDADYVVWGHKSTVDDRLTWTTGLYKQVDGSSLFTVAEDISPDNERAQASLGVVIAERLAAEAATGLESRNATHAALFAKAVRNGSAHSDLKAPITRSLRARREILRGLESLEQAVGFPRGDSSVRGLLTQAETALQAAETIDTDNPFVHMLLASCRYNLAHAKGGPGVAEADRYIEAYRKSLEAAYRLRDKATYSHIATEIEADYALLIERDYEKAIQLYESLLSAPEDTQLRAQLRAHWMLAGINCGDWGVSADYVDPVKGRMHLIAILAKFDGSPLAEFVRSSTLWDKKDGTLNPIYRRDNTQLAASLHTAAISPQQLAPRMIGD